MKVLWEKNQSLSLQGFLTLERLGDTTLEVRVKYLSQIWGCREGDTPYLEGGRRQKQHQERERECSGDGRVKPAQQASCMRASSVVSDSVTSRTVACQASLYMGLFGQESWSGLPFPSPGDDPGPGVEPTSPASPTLAGRFFNNAPPVTSTLRP